MSLPCACCGELVPEEIETCAECGGQAAADTVPCPAGCEHGRVSVWRGAPWMDESVSCAACQGEGEVEAPFAYAREVFPWLVTVGQLFLVRKHLAQFQRLG